jgi:hypothetical protein
MIQTSFLEILNGKKFYLHLLAHREKAERIENLATPYPAIIHLSEAAMRDVVDEMRRVCEVALMRLSAKIWIDLTHNWSGRCATIRRSYPRARERWVCQGFCVRAEIK